MKKSNRWIILAVVAGLWLLIMACEGVDENIRLPLFEIESSKTLSGQVTGTAEADWMNVLSQPVVCPDSAADYQMTIAGDSKLPADTHLTSKISDKLHYFRLDVYAVLRILDEGGKGCIVRDPSDDRTHVMIEGSFDGTTNQFKALSCSIFGEPSSSEIYYTADFVVSGAITCTLSDQYKWNFNFSGLQLK